MSQKRYGRLVIFTLLLIICVLCAVVLVLWNRLTVKADTEIIESHLARSYYYSHREGIDLMWLLLESVSLCDAMTGHHDYGAGEYREFLESGRSFLIPIDDVCFVDQGNIRDIDGKYSAILVFNEGDITGYAMREVNGQPRLYSGPAPRGLYEDAAELGIDIVNFYLVRSMYNLTHYKSESMCDAFNHGIRWTSQDGEVGENIGINPIYQADLEEMEVQCDLTNFSWIMQGPGGEQRYCTGGMEAGLVPVLDVIMAFEEHRNLEEGLEEIRCNESL